jgi:hypothetical protein
MREGLLQMTKYLAPDAPCIARILADVYGRESTRRVCGGCPACRRAGNSFRSYCPPLPLEYSPKTSPHLVIVTGAPERSGAGATEAWILALRRALGRGMRRLMCRARDRRLVSSWCDKADPDRRWWYRIDTTDTEAPDFGPGEEVVVLHLGSVDENALGLRQGRTLYHVLEDRIPFIDVHGRYPLESDGATVTPFSRWSLVH